MFRRCILFWLLVWVCMGVCASAGEDPVRVSEVMKQVSAHASRYGGSVAEYEAGMYVKGRIGVRRKNFLFRYIPVLFPLQKGVDHYLTESYSQLHYTAPNVYDQKVLAEYTTVSNCGFHAEVQEFLHINVYATALVGDRLVSPLSSAGRKYYHYYIDSVFSQSGHLTYKVRFMPKSKSERLVGGYVLVTDSLWSVREIRFSGKSGLMTFENLIRMGDVGAPDELLPRQFDYHVRFRFMGNVLDGSYQAVYDYDSIRLADAGTEKSRGKGTYNLTESYTLQCDTGGWNAGKAFLDSVRPYPLSGLEREVCYRWEEANRAVEPDTLAARSGQFLRKTGNLLFSDLRFTVPQLGVLRFSPLVNPFLLSYSKSNGFSWRQDLNLNRYWVDDRSLSASCRLGYNFKYREFYWGLSGLWTYSPEKHGSFYVGVGNGNRIYSSEVLENLRQLPDSLVDFNQMFLGYFEDLYLELNHRYEPVNGLDVQLGVIMHRRTALDLPRFAASDENLQVPDEFRGSFRNVYVSFAPRVRLRWTPGLYYYYNGHRKVDLYSHYPTFSLDYERGLKGVLGSTGAYERIEFDMQHQVPLKGLDRLFYRVGAGIFSNREELYFVDFVNFERNNLPVGWSDEIGGTFQLLNGDWYNSSRMYFRGHITYETPFLFFRHLIRYTRYVQKEKIYANLLVMPHLYPYLELGYGIGTAFFDFGVFVGVENWKKAELGCKVTFELFNE